MRRSKAILAVVAVVATMVMMSAPVIAQSQELTSGLDITRLLGLGAGALLVSGGLLIPRVIR
jgi:tetrahydromethanopterin S-methyltransferase subunit F